MATAEKLTDPAPRPAIGLTAEEYLTRERGSAEKHELRDGELVAMSGASTAHSLIGVNLTGELRARLKGGACQVFGSDLRVEVDPTGTFVYPDATIACGALQLRDQHQDTLRNPTVVIEILSPSTEAYDRGRKFESYRKIASLRQYVLVAQDRPVVEIFSRQDGDWVLHAVSGLDGVVRLDAVGVELPMAEVYDRVRFGESVSEESPP